jgi:flagellar hook assembly protein FlgD
LQQPAMTTVTVVDINGRTVATIHDGDLTAGTHELTLDASALANGAYTIVVNADGAWATSAIRVAR